MPKMPTMPSFIPTGDVSYIKPQYSTSSLNRNMIFPGTPQSLPQLMPPPPLPQLMPPPPLPQLMAPPQQPVNISFDNMFGNMLENALMPREYGFKPTSYSGSHTNLALLGFVYCLRHQNANLSISYLAAKYLHHGINTRSDDTRWCDD